jgi:hypothetical protein
MRVDRVEIKANVADGRAAEAVASLQLVEGAGEAMRIWFFEDDALSLLGRGVAVRVREKDGGDDGESTVKLRPCDRDRLTDEWLGRTDEGKVEVRIEEDWSSKGRVLAASCERDLDPEDFDAVDADAHLPGGVLVDDQLRFVADGTGVRLDRSALLKLGPIAATRWEVAEPPGLAQLGCRAERWAVAGLDLLELSVEADPAEPEQVQRAFTEALAAAGVPLDTAGRNKTERVLEALRASTGVSDGPEG